MKPLTFEPRLGFRGNKIDGTGSSPSDIESTIEEST